MAELEVTYEDPLTLIPDPDNARQHGERNKDAIVRSIRQFGVRKPIVAHQDTKVVYAGNGFLEAAISEGLETVPVAWIPKDVPTEVAKAYAIADNQSALLAEWDLPKLDVGIIEAQEYGIEPIDLGFDVASLEDTFADNGNGHHEVTEDEFDVDEALAEEPCSQLGDLWTLGEHRVLCGDCTVEANVERLMNGEKADLCLTDPPYNVGKEGYKDEFDDSGYREFSKKWHEVAMNVSECLVFTSGKGMQLKNIPMWFSVAHPKWLCMWVKMNAMTRNEIGGFQQWEPIFVYGSPGKRVFNEVFNIPITVQVESGHDLGTLHPTPKQIKLWGVLLESFGEAGDAICDPFLGSGTTLIAAQQLNRKCYGMEIEPMYIDVIVKRYAEFVDSTEDITCEREGQTLSYDDVFGAENE